MPPDEPQHASLAAPVKDPPAVPEASVEEKPLGPMDYLLAAVFGGTVLIVLMQVVYRYVLNNSLTWTEEICRYLFTWMIFLGAALAIRDGSHVTVDLISRWAPKRWQRAAQIVQHVLVVVFLAVVAVLGWRWVAHSAGTRSPAMGLPVNWVFYAALPVGCCIAMVYTARKLLPGRRHDEANPSPASEDSVWRG